MIPPFRAGAALGIGLLVTHGFGLSLIPALLPNISESLEAGYTELGLAVGSGLLAYSTGAMASARLLERLPNRMLLLATLLLPIVALLGVSMARSGVGIAVMVAVLGVNGGVSWPVSVHTLASTVSAEQRTAVMAGAGAGAGLGLVANGVLVQLVGTILTWQQAIRLAALVGLIPLAVAAMVFRSQIPRPTGSAAMGRGYRMVLGTTAGRIIILTGLAGGMFAFPVISFLSVIAREELGASATGAAMLWWLTGSVGMIVSPLFGRFGQRTTPLLAITVGALLFVAGLVVMVTWWTYIALAMLAVLLTAYHYPMWGLTGSIASGLFEPSSAVQSVALGLVAAAIGGSIGNAAAGAWYDATGSLRIPVALILVGMLGVTATLVRTHRNDNLIRSHS